MVLVYVTLFVPYKDFSKRTMGNIDKTRVTLTYIFLFSGPAESISWALKSDILVETQRLVLKPHSNFWWQF